MDIADAVRTRSPPRLQLDLPGSNSSFKRTFEELGFDLADNEDSAASPQAGGSASGSGSSDEDISSSSSRYRNKRARSEESDLASGSTSASISGRNPSTSNTSIHLSPIEGVSPIMNSLHWEHSSPRATSSLSLVDTYVSEEEDVQMVDASMENRATNASPPPFTGRPLLQLGTLTTASAVEPFVSSPLRQSFQPEGEAEEDMTSEGGSSSFTLLRLPGSSSSTTPSQYTLGLPEQDFFGPGPLRSTTPPWLRPSLAGLQVPQFITTGPGFGSTDSLVASEGHRSPRHSWNGDLPGSSQLRFPSPTRDERELSSHPPTSSLSLDSPPSSHQHLQHPSHHRRFPLLRRSSSLLSLRASPSLALDEGTAVAGSSTSRHARTESPLFPHPPAPRAGVSYRYDESAGEWVGGPTHSQPTPSPTHTRFGGIPRRRLGEFLELAPSPSPTTQANWRFGGDAVSPSVDGNGDSVDEDWNDSSWGQLDRLASGWSPSRRSSMQPVRSSGPSSATERNPRQSDPHRRTIPRLPSNLSRTHTSDPETSSPTSSRRPGRSISPPPNLAQLETSDDQLPELVPRHHRPAPRVNWNLSDDDLFDTSSDEEDRGPAWSEVVGSTLGGSPPATSPSASWGRRAIPSGARTVGQALSRRLSLRSTSPGPPTPSRPARQPPAPAPVPAPSSNSTSARWRLPRVPMPSPPALSPPEEFRFDDTSSFPRPRPWRSSVSRLLHSSASPSNTTSAPARGRTNRVSWSDWGSSRRTEDTSYLNVPHSAPPPASPGLDLDLTGFNSSFDDLDGYIDPRERDNEAELPGLISIDDSDDDQSISSTQVNTSISRPRTEADDSVTEDGFVTPQWMHADHPRLPSPPAPSPPSLRPRMSSDSDDVLLPGFGRSSFGALEPLLTLPSFPSLDLALPHSTSSGSSNLARPGPSGSSTVPNTPIPHTESHFNPYSPPESSSNGRARGAQAGPSWRHRHSETSESLVSSLRRHLRDRTQREGLVRSPPVTLPPLSFESDASEGSIGSLLQDVPMRNRSPTPPLPPTPPAAYRSLQRANMLASSDSQTLNYHDLLSRYAEAPSPPASPPVENHGPPAHRHRRRDLHDLFMRRDMLSRMGGESPPALIDSGPPRHRRWGELHEHTAAIAPPQAGNPNPTSRGLPGMVLDSLPFRPRRHSTITTEGSGHSRSSSAEANINPSGHEESGFLHHYRRSFMERDRDLEQMRERQVERQRRNRDRETERVERPRPRLFPFRSPRFSGELGRGFASLEEFFADFDRRHGLEPSEDAPAPPDFEGPWGNARRPWRMRSRPTNWGDFIRDQDFDDSYDNLLRLGAIMGEVKPRGTPQEIIDGLEKKKYKEWKENAGEGEEVELRCCICLDEYEDNDEVQKMNCAHWFHTQCLGQWLKGATSCPVCRRRLNRDYSSTGGLSRAGPSRTPLSSRHEDPMPWTFGPAPPSP